MNPQADTDRRMGFAGGTLLSFIANIHTDDIIRTVLLTAVGAMVSFMVSSLLKKAMAWYKKRRQKQ